MRNLRRLGMEDFRSQSYRNLSGGQQQRVLLARALCATEKLLVLDEPVTGLDPLVTAELYALIDSLNHEDGVAVLMVSHDIASALQHAGKILHLDTGLLYYGPAGEYLSSEAGRRLTGGKQSA